MDACGGVIQKKQLVLPPKVDLLCDLRPDVPDGFPGFRDFLHKIVRPCRHGQQPRLIPPRRKLPGVDTDLAALPDGGKDGQADHGGLTLFPLAGPNGYLALIQAADQLVQFWDAGFGVWYFVHVHLFNGGDFQQTIGRQLVGVFPEVFYRLISVLVLQFPDGGTAVVHAVCGDTDLHRRHLLAHSVRQSASFRLVRPDYQDELERLQKAPSAVQIVRRCPYRQGSGVDLDGSDIFCACAEPQAVRG